MRMQASHLCTRYTLIGFIALTAFFGSSLAASAFARPRSQATPVPCAQYGVNRGYGGGWGTMALIRRGERPGRKDPYALYEVLIRVNYPNRPAVDRTGLVVAGAAWARFARNGAITGYHAGEWTNVRPEPGKQNPYYVHTTVTARIGLRISFSAAAASGPDLVFWGPIDSCIVT